MRTTVSENQVLTKFYVAVLYRWHPFIPSEEEIINMTEEQKERIKKDGTSIKKLLFSSSSVSDLIEFAEYKFKFKIDGEKKEYLLNNFLDSASRKLVGSQFRDLQKIEHIIVPQLSEETRDWNENVDGYFGGISLDNTRISLIDVPEEVWKIEIYKEDQKEFIEYSICNLLGVPTEEPLLTIELGPDPIKNYSMNSSEMYYIDPNFDIRKEPENKEYISLLQEIYDRKVFYIVQTPNNISTVNISLSSWNSAKVPHRNKKYWNVTNDYFSGKTFKDESIFITKYKNTLIDSNSMTLLGNTEIKDIPPLLKEKIERSKNINNVHTFKDTVVYNEGDEVIYKGNKYRSLISGNIWDKPDISGNWTKITENGATILNKIEENKSYVPITVISDGGNVYPNGNISAKLYGKDWYKIFTIEEPLGYVFTSLLVDYSYEFDKKSISNYLTQSDSNTYSFILDQGALKNRNTETKKLQFKDIEFVFEKFIPFLNINFIVSNDYYYDGTGLTRVYNNSFPKGIGIYLNGENMKTIYGGVKLNPGSKYEIEVFCDNEFYSLTDEIIYSGIADKNITDINIPVNPREYKCIFKGYQDLNIVVNGDSSKICYYGQDCIIEFCFDSDKDTLLNWEIKKRIKINGETLDNTKYLVNLVGGGNIEGKEDNNYVLTIKNVNQDFNIEIS